MASNNSDSLSCCAENLFDEHPSTTPASSTEERTPEPRQQEYNFVDEPPPEYFCPVTFELLRDPKQTECCGHHLSGNVVARLQKEGKPCPLCKEPNLTVTNDKYFKRKANELKVRCSHKRNGCKWEGELGNLDHHSNSCPKRPWQCQYCDFRGTYDIGTTNHLPNCTKYPEPCPNQCDIGTVPRCDMEKHLTECPLQLVECEFAQAGCREKILRQDLSRHMEEGAQRHLLSMSLLNLSLTKELHQKMTEKDQQIEELRGQLQEQSRKQEEQYEDLLQQIQSFPCMATGFSQSFEVRLTAFSVHKAKGESGEWYSESFYCLEGYKFKLNIDTNGYGGAQGTHISAYLFRPDEDDKEDTNEDDNEDDNEDGSKYDDEDGSEDDNEDDTLSWPINVTARLQLFNQQGDHRHVVASVSTTMYEWEENIEVAEKFIAHSKLGYNAVKNTQYLKDDCLHFRLYLQVKCIVD